LLSATFSLNKAAFSYNEGITASFSRASGASTTDWVAIFPRSVTALSATNPATLWLYTCNSRTACSTAVAEGSVAFTSATSPEWPLSPGEYYADYFQNDGYARLSGVSRIAFTVDVEVKLTGAVDLSAAPVGCRPSVVLLAASVLAVLALLWK